MKTNIKAAYLTALGISFPFCILGAIVAAAGQAAGWPPLTAAGGIMTLPLSALLGVPALAIVVLGPLAGFASYGAGTASGRTGKAIAAAGLVAGAAWAVLISKALYGVAFSV